MPDEGSNRDLAPLSDLSLHILLALGAGAAHGYAVGKEIEARTDGRLNPTTGGLYQALKRLREDGFIERAPEAEARSDDSRRNYFRLTALGREAALQETRRLHGLVAYAREVDLFPEST